MGFELRQGTAVAVEQLIDHGADLCQGEHGGGEWIVCDSAEDGGWITRQ